MRSYLAPQIEPIELLCAVAGNVIGHAKVTWSVDVVIEGDYPDPILEIRLPDGRAFSNGGPDLFECLLQLRKQQLDALEIRIACNGKPSQRLGVWNVPRC